MAKLWSNGEYIEIDDSSWEQLQEQQQEQIQEITLEDRISAMEELLLDLL